MCVLCMCECTHMDSSSIRWATTQILGTPRGFFMQISSNIGMDVRSYVNTYVHLPWQGSRTWDDKRAASHGTFHKTIPFWGKDPRRGAP